jgi:hypothetical protein
MALQIGHGGLDLSAPMFAPCSLGCPGTPRQHPVSAAGSRCAADAGRRIERQFAVGAVTTRQQYRKKNRMQERTLNPRVRGSSPWRRTRSDLGLYRSRPFFMCPVCPHGGSVFARESRPRSWRACPNLAGSGSERSLRRPTWVGQWSIPPLGTLPVGSLIQLRSVKPAGSVESYERRTGRTDAASRKCRVGADDGAGVPQ